MARDVDSGMSKGTAFAAFLAGFRYSGGRAEIDRLWDSGLRPA